MLTVPLILGSSDEVAARDLRHRLDDGVDVGVDEIERDGVVGAARRKRDRDRGEQASRHQRATRRDVAGQRTTNAQLGGTPDVMDGHRRRRCGGSPSRAWRCRSTRSRARVAAVIGRRR